MIRFINPNQQNRQNYACHHCHFAKSTTTRVPAAVFCPQCQREMHNMGAGFVAPHSSDQNQWQKVELLIKHDFEFEFLNT